MNKDVAIEKAYNRLLRDNVVIKLLNIRDLCLSDLCLDEYVFGDNSSTLFKKVKENLKDRVVNEAVGVSIDGLIRVLGVDHYSDQVIWTDNVDHPKKIHTTKLKNYDSFTAYKFVYKLDEIMRI